MFWAFNYRNARSAEIFAKKYSKSVKNLVISNNCTYLQLHHKEINKVHKDNFWERRCDHCVLTSIDLLTQMLSLMNAWCD